VNEQVKRGVTGLLCQCTAACRPTAPFSGLKASSHALAMQVRGVAASSTENSECVAWLRLECSQGAGLTSEKGEAEQL
jgi:hypothetical protein